MPTGSDFRLFYKGCYLSKVILDNGRPPRLRKLLKSLALVSVRESLCYSVYPGVPGPLVALLVPLPLRGGEGLPGRLELQLLYFPVS